MTSFAHDSPRLAELYDRVSDLQFEEGQRLVERLELRAGERVLDVGCGTGRLTRWMSECVGPGGTVIGLDPLEDRIDLARSHGGGPRFVVGQAEALSTLDDASFDAVCMSAVLHWVSDKAQALREARRVLRPGGRLGVTTQPSELSRSSTLGNVLGDLFARDPWAGRIDRSHLTFARGSTTTELMSLVVESGLSLSELHVTPRARTWPTGEAVVAFAEASSFGTFLRPVSEALRPALRSDLVASLEAQRHADGVTVRGWSTLLLATRA